MQTPRSLRLQLKGAALAIIILLALAAILLSAISRSHKPFSSVEVQFADRSAGGLSIIPASCPSDPHSPAVCDLPANNDCTLTPDSATVQPGQPATLTWSIAEPDWDNTTPEIGSGSPTESFTGNISPVVGVVTGMSGAVTVHPNVTTTYVLSGTVTANLPWGAPETGTAQCVTTVTVPGCQNECSGGNVVNSCTGATVQVCADQCSAGSCSCPSGKLLYQGQCLDACPSGLIPFNGTCLASCPLGYEQQGNSCVFTACPAGYAQNQSGQCVQACTPRYYCSQSSLYYTDSSCNSTLSQACTYGCSGGACNATPAPGVQWQVVPTLVKSGSTTNVSWSASDVQSCTVTGSNGDTWYGTNGSQISSPLTAQTTFTLTCQALAGANPSTITRSTVVSLVPIFNEH